MKEIHRFGDSARLAKGAAEFVLATGKAGQAHGGLFSLALSGGNTPKAAFRALADHADEAGLDWERVRVFWGDERCVPPNDPESNYRMARETLLDRLPVSDDHIFRMACEADPEQGARNYEATLRVQFGATSLPRFDLILLGLGPDGHTASLFPGTAALDARGRWVLANYVEKMEAWRMTLSLEVINAAAVVAFVVEGEGKADILRRVLNDPLSDPPLPAQMIRPSDGEVHWFIDDKAAAKLSDAPSEKGAL
jgi:6-phosphogluconolactonase